MAISKKPSPKPRPKQEKATAAEPDIKRASKVSAKPEVNDSPKPSQAAAPAAKASEALSQVAADISGERSAKSEPMPPPEAALSATAAASSTVQPSAEPVAEVEPQAEMAPGTVSTASREVEMNVELPQQAAKFARRSVDQAQAAFDTANDLAHSNVQIFDAAAGAFKANAAELQLKAMEIAQANSNAVFGLARRMLAARQASELFDVQRSFMSEQFLAFVRQMNDLNAITLRLASETAKPLQQGVLKSFDELKKAASA